MQKALRLMLYPYSGELVFSGYGDNTASGCNIQTDFIMTDGVPRVVGFRKTGTFIEILADTDVIVTGRPPLLSYTSTALTVGANGTEPFFGHLANQAIIVPSSVSDLNLYYAVNKLYTLINGAGGGADILTVKYFSKSFNIFPSSQKIKNSSSASYSVIRLSNLYREPEDRRGQLIRRRQTSRAVESVARAE